MKKWYLVPALLITVLLINSCQKERSVEGGFKEATGSLQSELGDCLPKTVAGAYEAGTAVDATNYIDINVNVATTGQYNIHTDTLNGIYFTASGQFSTMGVASVRLFATGTPLTEGTDNFTVAFGTSTCAVPVVTLPVGAGGPAVYTLSGSPGACTGAIVEGVYSTGSALNETNTVEIAVQVDTIGTYTITTTAVDGMTFSGTGTFAARGATTVVLTGSGTPTQSGPQIISVPGTQACTFQVNVIGPAEFTIDCASVQVNGEYQAGVPLDASNEITLNVVVTSPGAYDISATVNGMTFHLNGEFPVASPDAIGISLPGSGTPVAAGTFNVEIEGAEAVCTTEITVNPSEGQWSFTEGATEYSGIFESGSLQSEQGSNVLTYGGDSDQGALIFLLGDMAAPVFGIGETYSTSNAASFTFQTIDGSFYQANPATPDVAMTFKITAHDPDTKTFAGTFTGTAEDENGASRTISNGSFTGSYP